MPESSVLDRLRVVLVRPSHPGNIGAAARAMRTMGLSHLVLVEPQRFPDSPNRRHFTPSRLAPGETYRHVSEFRFA